MNGRAVPGATAAAALVVVAAFARSALALAGYPWDWAPDEGLALDYARRVVEAPGTLYGRELIPFPGAYTPLLPLLLAPLSGDAAAALFAARMLAVAWTAGACAAIALLVRGKAGAAAAALAVALVLAPRDSSVWFLLVRVDGLMIALWLGAAVFLVPDRLAAGADRLTRARLAAGTALLLAAVLAKPTAVVHGAPLVLGWLVVDRPSFWRLAAAMTAAGLGALLVLQWATDGGFLWTMRLWSIHPRQPGLLATLVSMFARAHAGVILFAAATVAAAWRGGAGRARDGAWLLVVGGLALVPALSKGGAWINYLLPLYCALVVLACRLLPALPKAAALVPAALAVALLARPQPLPAPEDAATAARFYAFVRERGRPLLATRPDLAYFVVGQPVETEGSGLPYLVAARVPGVDTLLERVRERRYRLVVALPYFWPNDPAFEAALSDGYAIVGTCALGYFYGRSEFLLLTPRGDPGAFSPAAGERCRAFAAGGSAVGDAP